MSPSTPAPVIPAASRGEGIRHHSFSAITTYGEVCSLQYRFRYVDRLPPERLGAALVFGSAMNAALLEIDQDLGSGAVPDPKRAAEALRASLREAFGDPELPVATSHGESEESLFRMGERLLELHLAKLDPTEVPILDVSRRFAVPILDETGAALPRPLVGEFDRLVRLPSGALGIVDWKTAAARWSHERPEGDSQATAYLMAATLLFGKAPAFFRYDLFLKTKEPGLERYHVERGSADFQRLASKVRVIDRAIASGVFLPNDRSFSCPTCPYRGACAAWKG